MDSVFLLVSWLLFTRALASSLDKTLKSAAGDSLFDVTEPPASSRTINSTGSAPPSLQASLALTREAANELSRLSDRHTSLIKRTDSDPIIDAVQAWIQNRYETLGLIKHSLFSDRIDIIQAYEYIIESLRSYMAEQRGFRVRTSRHIYAPNGWVTGSIPVSRQP